MQKSKRNQGLDAEIQVLCRRSRFRPIPAYNFFLRVVITFIIIKNIDSRSLAIVTPSGAIESSLAHLLRVVGVVGPAPKALTPPRVLEVVGRGARGRGEG